MKKVLIFAGIAIGVSLAARRAATMCRQCNFAEMVERMPDDAPPKWMFGNCRSTMRLCGTSANHPLTSHRGADH